MNVDEADQALTEAVGLRDEAARLLEAADAAEQRAESALFVAATNRASAARHLAAMTEWVAQRERVLRGLTIANDGGHHPKETQ